MEKLLQEYKEKGLTLGSVESMTGGLFSAKFTEIPGSSAVFKGGIVTYSVEEKVNIVGVNKDTIERYGVVSKEVASEMAEKGRKLLNVDVCVSVTGNAGPTAMENKPVGLVFIGVAIYDHVEVYRFELKGSRNDIQKEGVKNALEILAKKILENF